MYRQRERERNSVHHGATVTMAQLLERVGLCSEGQQFHPRPCESGHGCCVPGQDTSATLPHVNVYECCMFKVMVGAVGTECAATLPSVCPRAAVATIVVHHHQYDCVNEWNLEPC